MSEKFDVEMNIDDDERDFQLENRKRRKRFSLVQIIAIIISILAVIISDFIIYSVWKNRNENRAQTETPKPIIKIIQIPPINPPISQPPITPQSKSSPPKVYPVNGQRQPIRQAAPAGLSSLKPSDETGEIIKKDPDGVYRNYK